MAYTTMTEPEITQLSMVKGEHRFIFRYQLQRRADGVVG